MNRRSPKHKGVYQRCAKECPADRCRTHKWAYAVELPPDPTGHRQQLAKGGYDSAKDAADGRAEVLSQHRAGTLPTDREKTFGAWLDECVTAWVERGDIRDSTERGYRDNIKNHLRPRLGHHKLAELRGVDLTRAYAAIARDRQAEIDAAKAKNLDYAAEAERLNAARAARGMTRMLAPKRVAVPRPVSPASIARIHAVVSGALGDAVPDLIPRSVAADAKLPKVTHRKVRPPTPEAYGELLDAIEGDRWYPLVLVAGHSGLRRGELCGLKWEHIDLKTGRIVLGPQRTSVGYRVVEREAKTEAGDERIVYLDADVLADLRKWKAQQNKERLAFGEAYHDGGYVFTREDGQPLHPDRITKIVKRAMVRHGLTTSKLHDLRHFRATALISAGVEIAAVSKTLGHKNISVTNDLYGNLDAKAAKDTADRARGRVPRQRRTG